MIPRVLTHHPGTLSGIHSLDGTGYNQWVIIDDTQHQLRMRLATSTAASQLNLGHLVHQSPTSAQRGSFRGEGFELRTDAWASIRGADGILIATTQRPGQGASVTSTQMDAAEAVAQMKAAHALSKTLCDAATHQTALSSKTAQTAQNDFITAIDPAQHGKYTAPVNGQAAQKTRPGTRDLDPTQPVEKFATPAILLDSPTNINWASPASTALFAGQHLHWTSQADLHFAAAHTLAAVSDQATTLFTHGGGIQAIAANGPVSLQAHTDQLEILADQAVTITSVNGDIEVKAQQKIVLQAEGASITLEGGNITLACIGSASVKGAAHGFEGAERGETVLVGLPSGSVAAPAPVGVSGIGAAAPTASAGTPIKTGLGDDVDKLAAKSPSLQKDWQKLKNEGWGVKYGPAGKGSTANRRDKLITIDGAEKDNPTAAMQSLSHEVGHATYPYKEDYSSKTAYVNGALADEGAATLNNIKVQREIIANGGPDIGIAGNSANHAAYNRAYDQFLKDGNAATARQSIGAQFGMGEITSNTGQSYADYYGGWYDEAFPPKK